MLSQYEKSHSRKAEDGGKRLEDTVTVVSGNSVFLDIGFKSEGILSLVTFQSAPGGDPQDSWMLLCPASLHPSCARLSGVSMPARGKFIVLEGIDGSGKRTQLEMLARVLVSRGIAFTQISFPQYDGFFGKLVARFLNGEFGSLGAVDAHFSALLYAGDRLEAKPQIEAPLAVGHVVLADRYIGSNLAHQGARVPRKKRDDFLRWLEQLEYGVYGLPREDLVIYLRMPPSEAHRLVGQKRARGYTKLQRDLQEANIAHLETASEVYDELARRQNWVRIECAGAARERLRGTETRASRKLGCVPRSRKSGAISLRSPQTIHEEILAAVEGRVLPGLHEKE